MRYVGVVIAVVSGFVVVTFVIVLFFTFLNFLLFSVVAWYE